MIGMDAPHLSGESVVRDERGALQRQHHLEQRRMAQVAVRRQLFDQPLAAPFSGSRSEPAAAVLGLASSLLTIFRA
jgi:hypothetical protein